MQLQHPVAAGQLEDIHGVNRVHGGDDAHAIADLAHGEGDVRVDLVCAGGHHQGRLIDAHLAIGFRIVDVPQRDADPVVVDLQGALVVVHHDDMVDPVIPQLLHQGRIHRAEAREDDVSPGFRRQLLGGTALRFRLDPRCPEELDDREWQQDQHEHNAREKHEYREGAADVRLERDIAEAEGGHHRQRPVDASGPGVLLALGRHQHVEHDAIAGHHHQ